VHLLILRGCGGREGGKEIAQRYELRQMVFENKGGRCHHSSRFGSLWFCSWTFSTFIQESIHERGYTRSCAGNISVVVRNKLSFVVDKTRYTGTPELVEILKGRSEIAAAPVIFVFFER
jgi:hypothetical protein